MEQAKQDLYQLVRDLDNEIKHFDRLQLFLIKEQAIKKRRIVKRELRALTCILRQIRRKRRQQSTSDT